MRHRGLSAAFLLAALAGCTRPQPRLATAGRDFPIGGLAMLDLAHADEAQVIALLGSPTRRISLRTIVTNPRFPLPVGTRLHLTVLVYFYVPGGAPVPGQVLSQDATVTFWDGKLFGYQLHRAVRGQGAPPFDEAKADLLERGSTTRAQAIAALGEPTGQTRMPAEPGLSENWVGHTLVTYDWTYRARGASERRRTVRLTFDANDVLTDITQTDTDGSGGPLVLPIPVPPKPGPESHPILPPGQFQPT